MFIIEIALGVALGIGMCALTYRYWRSMLKFALIVLAIILGAYFYFRPPDLWSLLSLLFALPILVIAYAIITGKWGQWWDRPTQYEKWHVED